MIVPLWPSADLVEHAVIASAGDLHGCIGSWRETEPDDSRHVIGFRPRSRPELVEGFPRGPAYSVDGKTWQPCDLHEPPR